MGTEVRGQKSEVSGRGTVASAALWTLAIAVILVAMISAQGCGPGQYMQVRPISDGEVQAILLRETGFTLAFYALGREHDEAVIRVAAAVVAAQKLMAQKDVGEVTRLVIKYIEDFPQWKTGVENYDVLIGRAVNVLSLLIEVDLTIPAKYEAAKNGLASFLAGASEGIEALRRTRTLKQGA